MLSSICTHNSVMLYWDLPEHFEVGNVFRVEFSAKTFTTKKCHINIEELSDDTEYTFSVYMNSEKNRHCNLCNRT